MTYKISLEFQSISVPNGSAMLIKSVLFYILMNVEAFIFCFVGEHLTTKVSNVSQLNEIYRCNENLLYISEQNDWRRGVRVDLV